MAKEKPLINIVFVGHVDHGKSTTVGRLMYDSGNVDEQQMRKLKEKAQELGKSGGEVSFVMYNVKEEQERETQDVLDPKFYPKASDRHANASHNLRLISELARLIKDNER